MSNRTNLHSNLIMVSTFKLFFVYTLIIIQSSFLYLTRNKQALLNLDCNKSAINNIFVVVRGPRFSEINKAQRCQSEGK